MKQNTKLTGIFQSATVRLTGWYLGILMVLSIMFSTIIYGVTTNEIHSRIENFRPMMSDMVNLERPVSDSEGAISAELLYLNLFVLLIGGVGSYYFAKRSLAPIKKAHDAQSQFTSDASHELRTPLAVMRTEIEVALRDQQASSSDLREVLSSNLEEVSKLSKLAEMLLTMSRLESNALQMGNVKLEKVISGVLDEFKKSNRRITLNVINKSSIYANEAAITDLIRILVENAINYSPDKSEIKTSLSADADKAYFEITNSGPGIEAARLPFIFDRFYRADKSRTSGPNKGYGLGLALAKNIISIHGGEIIVASTPDESTTFTVIIPKKSADSSQN